MLKCAHLYSQISKSHYLVAQTVKNLPATQETWVWSLGLEDPLKKGVATHYSILAWRMPWTEEPGGLQSMGSQRVGHDWVTNISKSRRHAGYILYFYCLLTWLGLDTIRCYGHLWHYMPWRSVFQKIFPTEPQSMGNDPLRHYNVVITWYFGISTGTRKLAERIPWASEDWFNHISNIELLSFFKFRKRKAKWRSNFGGLELKS